MTTDTAKLLERFKAYCLEWDLQSGEADMAAHEQALVAMHKWLLTGAQIPEVIIRAVQVLMLDPERPGVHKRPAVKQVCEQLSVEWKSAGLKPQDVRILQGMILAAWPQLIDGGESFLVLLLESAWAAIPVSKKSEEYLKRWRSEFLGRGVASDSRETVRLEPVPSFSFKVPSEVAGLDFNQLVANVGQVVEGHLDRNAKAHFVNLLNNYQSAFNSVYNNLAVFRAGFDVMSKYVLKLEGKVNEIVGLVNSLSDRKSDEGFPQLQLLWWGQAKYSSSKAQSYRGISSRAERVWWMAWESSELALGLEVEPAACFLAETVRQTTPLAEFGKRPLKEWLRDLIEVLRDIHDQGQYGEDVEVGAWVSQIAEKDAVGLPVTWARLEAAAAKPSTKSIEDSIREQCALDPDTELDLADWASWVFREALLDRYLESL